LYDFNPEKETFSNTENTQIKNFATQAREAAESNQKAKTAKLIKIVKLKVIMKNLFIDLNNYKIIKELKYTLEVETETTTEPKLVVGIKTPLDIISITLQNRRESN